MEPIILASASPRRQDFFRLLDIPFTAIPADIDETPPPELSPRQAAEAIALRKVMAVVEKMGSREWGVGSKESSSKYRGITRKQHHTSNNDPHSLLPTPHSPQWVFGADTIVVLENEIYGKPPDRNAAKNMLERLSGRRHEVITAIALYNSRKKSTDCRSAVSEVSFTTLSPADIEWYLDSGEWEGVAGAYRLQGLGACLISSIKGSPSGVAGLPLFEFYDMLKSNGYSLNS